MGSLFKWCWTALGNISTVDWIFGFFGSTVFGALSAVFAWAVSLPILWTGLIGFAVAVVIWTVREINTTIKRLERHASGNPDVKYLRAGNKTHVKGKKTRGPTQKQTAFIKFRVSGDIQDAYNVSAITDMGTGLFAINFAEEFLSDDVVVSVVGTPPKDFTIASVSRSHAVVRFSEDGDPMIALSFEEARRPEILATGDADENPPLESEEAALKAAEDTSKPFDVREWANQQNYFVWVAACLWAEIRPTPEIPATSPAYRPLQLIKADLVAGKAKSVDGLTVARARISIQELRKIAKRAKEQPKFLFPDALAQGRGLRPKAKNYTDDIEELRAQVAFDYGFNPDSEETKKAGILLLAKLRSQGVVIRNDVETVVDITAHKWVKRTHDWMRIVIEAIGYLNAADAEIFSTLDTVPNARVQMLVKVTDAHLAQIVNNAFRQHDLRLVRLKEFIDKYQGSARG